MLNFTLAMKILFTLVIIAVFSIHCHGITIRNDDDDGIYDGTSRSSPYSDSELTSRNAEYTREEYYQPLRRADVRTYQFTSEQSNQEPEYFQPQLEQRPENYGFNTRTQQNTRRKTQAKKTHVEQYLKEVAPTTKTTYNQKPTNYLRLSGQPSHRDVKEEQRGILKQPSIQYIVQSDLQQKSATNPQIQYVIAEPKPEQFRQSEVQPTLTTYQNALLAHQKVLETESQDETSRSSIYVTHSIPKKPVRKVVKPSPVDEDIEQYRQMQQYKLQQKQPVYEAQAPAEVRYQAKIEYSNGDSGYQTTTEVPSYQHEKEVQRQQFRHIQYQQVTTEGPIHQREKLVQQRPQQPTRYQILSGKITRPIKLSQHPEGSPETSYQSSEIAVDYETPAKTNERSPIQFQQSNYLKKGPKYLPEPKVVQHQPSKLEETEEKYQQVIHIPSQGQERIAQYQAAIAKLQTEKLLKARQQQTLRPQAIYQENEEGSQTVGYTLQYGSDSQEVKAPEREYIRIGESIKHRPIESIAVSYRQPQQNHNIRYFRNPGKPVITYTQYE